MSTRLSLLANQHTPKNALENFIIQIQGDLQFAEQHIAIYPNIVIGTQQGENITCQDLNYDIYLLRLIVVSLVSNFEAFMETICRKALLSRHTLFGQFDPSLSWKQINISRTISALWEVLADQVLSGLQSGKLRTFAKVFKNIGVTIPSDRSKRGKALNELIMRRNMIVHNESKPNKDYLRIVPSPKTYSSGGLVIDIDYVKKACDLLMNTSRDMVHQLVNRKILGSSEI